MRHSTQLLPLRRLVLPVQGVYLESGLRLRDVFRFRHAGEDFIRALAVRRHTDDLERIGLQVLTDYRNGALGAIALELPKL